MAWVSFGTTTASAATTCLNGDYAISGVCSVGLFVPGAALEGYPTPFATGTVTWLDSTHATIEMNATTIGGFNYTLGGESALGFNIFGTATVDGGTAGITLIGGGTKSKVVEIGPKNSVGGFGEFDTVIKLFAGLEQSVKGMQFSITAAAGTEWLDAGHILELNADLHSAVGHIFVNNGACGGSNPSCVTGFASWPGEEKSVPEPGTLALLGTGLLGIGFWSRKLTTRKR